MKQLQVLITNAYSARNKGDAAIIGGMIRALRARPSFRDAVIRVSSNDYPGDSGHYDAVVVPSFNSLKDEVSGNQVMRFLAFLVVLLPLSLLWAVIWRAARRDFPVPTGLRALLRLYAESDLVVACGGGYLYTHSRIRGNVVLLIVIFSFYCGVLLGKPVCLYAQSVGPFAGWWQEWLVRRALGGVCCVQAREDCSFRLLSSWRLKTSVERVEDAAFLLAPESIAEKVRRDRPRIGVTVRKWFRDPAAQKRYEEAIGKFLDKVVARMDADICFLPQVTHVAADDDDRPVARSAASFVSMPDRVRLIEEELTPQALLDICAGMDYFIGTRMHSAIFALSMGVPTLAIGYQPKTIGIMKSVGLEEFAVDMGNLSVQSLEKVFCRLVAEQQDIVEHLRKRIPEIRAGAMRAGEIIEECYSRAKAVVDQ